MSRALRAARLGVSLVGMLLLPQAWLLGPDCGALEIYGYSAARHDRFASGYPSNPVPNPTFFAAEFDWSGVGWDAANAGRSVALISPQHFVCANHYRPAGPIVFRNRAGVLESRTVAGFYTTITDGYGTADLCLGKLSQPVSKDVTYYPVLNPSSLDWFLGRLAHVYGKTARVGTNHASSRVINNSTICNAMRKHAIADEAHFESGDSGSPSLIAHGGVLTAVGTHLSVNTSYSIDSCIPAYLSQLNAHMAPDYAVATIDPGVATPTVQITTAAQTAGEGDGTVVITAQLSAATSLTVTIPFAVTGTATAGADADFTITASPLTIPAGSTSATITVTLNDDGLAEEDETVVVTLWTPTNAIRGAVFEHVLTLQDSTGAPAGPLDVDGHAGAGFRDLSFCYRYQVLGPGNAVPPGATLPEGETAASIEARIVTLFEVQPDGFPTLDVTMDGVVDASDFLLIDRRLVGHPETVPEGMTLPEGVTEADVNARIDALVGG